MEGAGARPYEGGGLCGRGRALKISRQIAGARGRRQSRPSAHMRAEPKSVRNWIKERSGVRMELKGTGISHAGCFLLCGLPEEYDIQSDCPVHE